MNTLHQNSLEKSESKNFSIKPILGKIITWVSLATALMVADWIKNDAKADIDFNVFADDFSKSYATNWIKSVNEIQNILLKNDFKKVKYIIKRLKADIESIKTFKEWIEVKWLSLINNYLDELSKNIENKEKSEEILKALKEQYILLRNEFNK